MAFFNTKNNNSENREKRAVVKYFEIIFSKASKLILLNLAYFACLIPLLCGAIYMVCVLFGVSAETIQSIYFVHLSVWITGIVPTPVFITLFFVSLIAYGPLTAGFTYCIRNIATEKHFWISDMFSRAKSNFKQGIVFGIIDVIVISSCILYLAPSTSSLQGANLVLFRAAQIVSILITITYIWIRFYSYTIAVTFELRIKDIFKNSLIFCVLGFFRNIIAIIVCAFILLTFISTPRIDIVLIAVLVLSLCRFTAVFSTYPIIEKYMLKTAKKKAQNDEEETEK